MLYFVQNFELFKEEDRHTGTGFLCTFRCKVYIFNLHKQFLTVNGRKRRQKELETKFHIPIVILMKESIRYRVSQRK